MTSEVASSSTSNLGVTNQIEKPVRKITIRDRAYILEFRHKNRFGLAQGRTKQKVFWFDGNLKEASSRVRIHCERMDYIFIYCSPFIVDLEAQEELKARDMNSDNPFEHMDEY